MDISTCNPLAFCCGNALWSNKQHFDACAIHSIHIQFVATVGCVCHPLVSKEMVAGCGLWRCRHCLWIMLHIALRFFIDVRSLAFRLRTRQLWQRAPHTRRIGIQHTVGLRKRFVGRLQLCYLITKLELRGKADTVSRAKHSYRYGMICKAVCNSSTFSTPHSRTGLSFSAFFEVNKNIQLAGHNL